MVIFLFLVMISMSFNNFLPNTKASANEIYVKADYRGYSDGTADKPYKTISEALNNAEEGDKIYVFSGLYQENFEINKKVTIVGIDEEETIIDTRFDRRYLVEITTDEVTIEGITFSDDDSSMTSPIGALLAINSKNNRIVGNTFKKYSEGYGIYIASSADDNLISNNIINRTARGIYIESSSTNDLANNEIHNCTDYGIDMDSSTGNNRLYSNTIYNCPHGIYVTNSENINLTYNKIVGSTYYAIYLSGTSEALITNNHLKNNDGDGFYLSASNSFLKNNTLEENKRGITLVGSNNIIENNTMISSSASGIYIPSGGNSNTLYLNKFRDNAPSAIDNGENIWYYQKQGNYWGDYNNIDKNVDGVGDFSYSKNGVMDKYPLGYFLKPPNRPSDPSPEDMSTDVSLDITLKVHVEDPDSDFLDVYFYNADTNESLGVDERVQNNTNAECSFTRGFNTTVSWYAVVKDEHLQNQSDPFLFFTINTPPDNKPPVAISGGPYECEAGEEILFDASESYDLDGEIEFYRWNFGDGTSEILKKETSHIFDNEGTYEITLNVIDNNGSSHTDTTMINVGPNINLPPKASIKVSSNTYTGKNIKIESKSSDPNNDDLNYTWSFDGNTYYDEIVYHTFNSPGEYIISLTVSDGIATNTTKTSIVVQNAPSDETPGFELVIALVSLLAILLIYRKRKQKR